jgi:hypothetical protein
MVQPAQTLKERSTAPRYSALLLQALQRQRGLGVELGPQTVRYLQNLHLHFHPQSYKQPLKQLH